MEQYSECQNILLNEITINKNHFFHFCKESKETWTEAI